MLLFIDGRGDAGNENVRSFQVVRIMSEGQVRGSEFIRRGFAGPVFSALKRLDALRVDVGPDRDVEHCRDARGDRQSDMFKTRSSHSFAHVRFPCSVFTGQGGLDVCQAAWMIRA